ncbi:MAG: hypothetical protein AB2629_04400 [Candidatus Thiodiazotropha sp.]
MDRGVIKQIAKLALFAVTAFLGGCGGSDNDSDPVTGTRPFLLGSTPFFTRHDGIRVIFPDWRFENLDDRDLLSLHVDDFWGVPWDFCDASACTNLPRSWVDQWQQLVNDAQASGKTLYLAVSPLGGRQTLAPNVLADGSTEENWNSTIDANGCYLFTSDPDAAGYKVSYITFLKYLVELVNPDYLSPAIEMNMPFTRCAAQKAAWIAWYGDVHAAIKSAYPELTVFPTFQLEYMYGNAEPGAACASGTMAECFETRLNEALAIPGDRIAFSSYPAAWVYHAEFDYSFPRDTLSKTVLATTRKIWIAETGWPAEPLLSSYPHGNNGSCGSPVYPATMEVPGIGAIDVANETAQNDYISWLLESADRNSLEAVVWWLNRDYLDDSVTGNEACPCLPEGDSTCMFLDDIYTVGGEQVEVLFRLFGNMALRRHDGSPRQALTTWRSYLSNTHRP